MVELAILWGIFFVVLKAVRGTRVMQLLGFLVVLVALTYSSRVAGLNTVHWLLSSSFMPIFVGLVVLYSPDLRRSISNLTKLNPFKQKSDPKDPMITEVVEAVKILSKRHIGALITIERDHSLQPFINTGIKLDAEVRSELLINIFSPLTPLHDGGVILSEGRIAAAACIYPVTQNLEFETKFGVRHRAALGLAEESDALTVIVSEETGDISLAIDSRVTRPINPATLQDRLVNIIKRNKTEE